MYKNHIYINIIYYLHWQSPAFQPLICTDFDILACEKGCVDIFIAKEFHTLNMLQSAFKRVAILNRQQLLLR